MKFTAIALAVAALTSSVASALAPVDGYKILATYPHSTDSYTEGFYYQNGAFVEEAVLVVEAFGVTVGGVGKSGDYFVAIDGSQCGGGVGQYP